MKKKKVSVTTVFERPAKTGFINLENLFPCIKKKIDPLFKELVFSNKLESIYYKRKKAKYELFKTEPGLNSDSRIFEDLHIELTCRMELLANIEYLSQHFSEFLNIPKGQEELNFILGYHHRFFKNNLKKKHELLVFFIEHELENGNEEIHFHVRSLNQWGNDCPAGINRIAQ